MTATRRKEPVYDGKTWTPLDVSFPRERTRTYDSTSVDQLRMRGVKPVTIWRHFHHLRSRMRERAELESRLEFATPQNGRPGTGGFQTLGPRVRNLSAGRAELFSGALRGRKFRSPKQYDFNYN